MTLQVPWDFMCRKGLENIQQVHLGSFHASQILRLPYCFFMSIWHCLISLPPSMLLQWHCCAPRGAGPALITSHVTCVGFQWIELKHLPFGLFLGIGSSGQAAIPCVQSPRHHYLSKGIL